MVEYGLLDYVDTPNAETLIDDLHPDGFQLISGSRIPLIMFGGQVAQGVESNWHSHVCICKTVIDQFGLHPSACRVSTAPSRSRVASAQAWPVPNRPPLALRSCSPLHQIPPSSPRAVGRSDGRTATGSYRPRWHFDPCAGRHYRSAAQSAASAPRGELRNFRTAPSQPRLSF